jgi:hypothetical protein
VKNVIVATMVVLVLAGCARRPDSIAPAHIPFEAYSSMDCAQINSLLVSERQILASLEVQQNSAATGDAVGVFLIGVPISSLSGGDQEGNIAVSKGKVQALEAAQLQNRCAAV